MDILEELNRKKQYIAVIGMGYVGLPLAIAFAKKFPVIGFDINERKTERLKAGEDPTKEVGDEAVKICNIEFTSQEEELDKAIFYIIAVPTPVNEDHTPDLEPLISASKIVGRHIKKGSIIVYESTVYPGVTQEVCLPALEQSSGLLSTADFRIGYSPERINPGDAEHKLGEIVKIVSGQDEEALNTIDQIYQAVIQAGTHRAESIRVAEAAKVVENAQRDINIAFMNELSLIFHKMDIDLKEVLRAAATKWNFIPFSPGLVGGHCIGVDPYYLTYEADKIGYHSQVILSGRIINDSMGRYIVENLVKCLIRADVAINHAKVAVLGITFKENCPDARNSKVLDIINGMKEYGIEPVVVDPVADKVEISREYGIPLVALTDVKDVQAVVLAVAHKEFAALGYEEIDAMLNDSKVLLDVKGILDKKKYEERDYIYWRL